MVETQSNKGSANEMASGLLKLGVLGFTALAFASSKEFVINLVSEDLAEAMDLTCIDAPAEVDEMALAGLANKSNRHGLRCVTNVLAKDDHRQVVAHFLPHGIGQGQPVCSYYAGS